MSEKAWFGVPPLNKMSDFERILIHIPVGIIACLLGYLVPGLGLAFVVGFIIYELNEDKHLIDNAWKDIRGLLWGMGIGGIVLLILNIKGLV